MADPPSHNIKSISFLGRRVPILLQDENGPCPLLAIANVLLLRNQLHLAAGAGEVSQDRLVAMVAERLLDSNSASLEAGSGLSEDQRASLAQNLSDAIGLLPKLTTGIDVNLRFHATSGFEYTPETAVFDLLDIPLVHGWLVDPQDEPTARAVGDRSYNELVVQLVTALGSAATPKQLTPCGSLRGQPHSGEGLTPRGSGAAAMAAAGAGGPLPPINEHGNVAGSESQPGGQRRAQLIDAEALSAALQHSLRVSEQQPLPAGAAKALGAAQPSGLSQGEGSRGPSSMSSMQTSDSMHSTVNRMLLDLVSDAFTSGGTPHTSRSLAAAAQAQASSSAAGAGSASGQPGVLEEDEGGEEATSRLRPGTASSGCSSTADLGGVGADVGPDGAHAQPAAVLASSPRPSGSLEWRAELRIEVDEAAAAGGQGRAARVALELRAPQQPPSPFDLSPSPSGSTTRQPLHSSSLARRSTPATPHTSAVSLSLEQQPALPSVAEAAAAAAVAGPSSGSASPRAGAAAAAAAPATGGAGSPAGSPGSEAAVREALLVQQFLEGHPSQLTYHGLVALQEGLRPNQLAVFFRNNHFNTMFKGPDGQLYLLATDEGFQFESDVVWEQLVSVDGDTQLVGGNFRPFQPHASHQDAAAHQAATQEEEWAAAAAASGGGAHDADLALAMQLQAEEEERAREEGERRRTQLARQQQEQQRQEEQRRLAQQREQQQQRVLPSQRRPSSAGSSGSSSSGGKKKKKSSTDSCSIM